MQQKKLILVVLSVFAGLSIIALAFNIIITYPTHIAPSGSAIHINQPAVRFIFNNRLDPKKTTITTEPKNIGSTKISNNAIQLRLSSDISTMKNISVTINTANQFRAYTYTYNFTVSQDTSSAGSELVEDLANESDAYEEFYPLAGRLPYSEIAGPFKVSYGTRQPNQIQTPIEISYSTPDGRKKAVKWLTDQGLNIETTDIRYPEFHNQLTGEGGLHE